MSKQPSARDLLRKAREQKKQQQQTKQPPAPATKHTNAASGLKRQHQQLQPDYEAQTSADVAHMQLGDRSINSPAKRPKVTEPISDMLVAYAGSSDDDDDDDDDEEAADADDNRLPAGFFDSGVQRDSDESDKGNDKSENSDDDGDGDELSRQLLAFENEVAALDDQQADEPAAEDTPAEDPPAEDPPAEDPWADRVHRLVELKQQLVAQLHAPEPIQDMVLDDESDSSDSDSDLAGLTDWRSRGLC
ncbi:hypothetical protein H4R99_001046 [Coemansia sp. RSA 1722]|nr:hypothetical protein H4R99_001046 [Coemansia sp. RSA 1722]KAJ2634883.1 hypothetical protein GGF40_003934 [Coemansia sp. RSA 1286]